MIAKKFKGFNILLNQVKIKYLIKIHGCNFSNKYIPLNKIKFKDEKFHESTFTVYEALDSIKPKYLNRLNIGLSIMMYAFLITCSGNLKLLFLNLLFQPFLYMINIRRNRKSSLKIKKIDLLKNGKQILVKTLDDSISIINIPDIESLVQIKNRDEFLLKTHVKHYYLDFSNKLKNFNSELFSVIKERRIIDTNKSFGNYHRLTIERY